MIIKQNILKKLLEYAKILRVDINPYIMAYTTWQLHNTLDSNMEFLPPTKIKDLIDYINQWLFSN